MAQSPSPNAPAAGTGGVNATLDHMVEELETFEGVGKRRWTKWLLGIVIAALVVGVVWWVERQPSKGEREVAAANEGVYMQIETPVRGKLTEPPREFRWQAVTGRDFYTVVVGTIPGKADVLEKLVRGDRLALTDEEVALFRPGKDYYWKVRAIAKDRRVIGHAESKFSL